MSRFQAEKLLALPIVFFQTIGVRAYVNTDKW